MKDEHFHLYVCIKVMAECRVHYTCNGALVQCDRHICSGADSYNVKCMYTSVFGHTVDCRKSYMAIHWHSCLLSAHKLISICGLYVELEGHICCWHLYG